LLPDQENPLQAVGICFKQPLWVNGLFWERYFFFAAGDGTGGKAAQSSPVRQLPWPSSVVD
jgi:hypothetical protein